METNNLDGICLWKDVANKDKMKLDENPNAFNITLSPDKPCYNCNGYNLECKLYKPLEN